MWTSESPVFGGAPPAPVRKLSFAATVAVAAAVLVAMLAVALLVRDGFGRPGYTAVVDFGDSSIYVVAGGRERRLQADDRVEFGDVVRSNGTGGMLRLADGSRVEVRSESELLFERADDGIRIRLHHGGLIVNAAKQRDRHLYVQTKDFTVAVVGTVFLVNAAEAGSRVAVLEGEVRVQQGASDQTLLPGEQVTTSPAMTAPALPEEIAWSRNAPAHLALLEQSAAPAQGSGSSASLAPGTALAEAASAQTSGGGVSQPLVLRADFVMVDFIVSDSAGQRVLDLLASDFKVFENNVEQEIETFELVTSELGTYYFLSYRMPVSSGASDSFRRIQVRVDRPGVTVHHRAAYHPRPTQFDISRPSTQIDGAAAQDDFSRGAHTEGEPGLVSPVPIEQRLPSYTAQGLLRRIQGNVVVEAFVDVDGRVARTRVVSSLDKNQFGLDDEAVKAVSQWTFTPGELKGQKVPVLLRLVAAFQMR